MAVADEDLANRTEELVRLSGEASAAAIRQANELDRAIEALRNELWGGGKR